jgi:hypothetical protein
MAVENFVKFPSMSAIATFKWIRRMDIKLTQRVAAEFFDFLCEEHNLTQLVFDSLDSEVYWA